jgi:hypothetical protein
MRLFSTTQLASYADSLPTLDGRCRVTLAVPQHGRIEQIAVRYRGGFSDLPVFVLYLDTAFDAFTVSGTAIIMPGGRVAYRVPTMAATPRPGTYVNVTNITTGQGRDSVLLRSRELVGSYWHLTCDTQNILLPTAEGDEITLTAISAASDVDGVDMSYAVQRPDCFGVLPASGSLFFDPSYDSVSSFFIRSLQRPLHYAMPTSDNRLVLALGTLDQGSAVSTPWFRGERYLLATVAGQTGDTQ